MIAKVADDFFKDEKLRGPFLAMTFESPRLYDIKIELAQMGARDLEKDIVLEALRRNWIELLLAKDEYLADGDRSQFKTSWSTVREAEWLRVIDTDANWAPDFQQGCAYEIKIMDTGRHFARA